MLKIPRAEEFDASEFPIGSTKTEGHEEKDEISAGYLKTKIDRKVVFNTPSQAASMSTPEVSKMSFISTVPAYESLTSLDYDLLNEVRMNIELKRIRQENISFNEKELLEKINTIFENTIDKFEDVDQELNELHKESRVMKRVMEDILKNG